jgi:hypothetical protein
MSDLSQLLTKQNNPLTLYMQGPNANVQVGNLLMPTVINNDIAPFTRPRPCLLSISGYRVPPIDQYSLDTYEYAWASAYSVIVAQPITTTQSQLLVTFTNPTVIGQNYGTFSNGVFTLPLQGYYKVNFGVTKYCPAGTLESSFRLKLDVNGVDSAAVIFCPLNDGTTAFNTGVSQQVSGSAYVLCETFQGAITLEMNVQTNITAGTVNLFSPYICLELISPFVSAT